MLRVARQMPVLFVCPQAWFPFQRLIRLWRPSFRPMARSSETIEGMPIFRPRFLSLPGVLKRADGWLLALSTYLLVRKLVRQFQVDLIDAHFAYPDGYAAAKLARWLGLPLVITMRGKEERQASSELRPYVKCAVNEADAIIAVSDRLAALARELGAAPERVRTIGNGVDLERFVPIAPDVARKHLGLPYQAKVLISVGGLVERKGFHRVIECLPALKARFPSLILLIVGGPGPEGSMEAQLRAQVTSLGLAENVRFLGVLRGAELTCAYSAADVFVLATRYEGWANVLLEAMACGLPVITTDVGGNAGVVKSDRLGTLVPFGDAEALTAAIESALAKCWDQKLIRDYAEQNSWDRRVAAVIDVFKELRQATGANGLK